MKLSDYARPAQQLARSRAMDPEEPPPPIPEDEVCAAPNCGERYTGVCDPCDALFCDDHGVHSFFAYGIETSACNKCRREEWD